MRKQLDLTTGLDLVGLCLVAGGVGGGLWSHIGAFALAPAGALVVGASWLAARLERR